MMLEIEPVRTRRTFVLFNDDEKRELLRIMLTEQGKGISVRGCAIAMAEGERSQMLRYQNKYRNLVRSNPELVRQVMVELDEAGERYSDPYAPISIPRRGRPAGRRVVHADKGLMSIVSGLVSDLEMLGSGEGEAFFGKLATLVHQATLPAAHQIQNEQFHKLASRYERLAQEHQILRQELEKRQHMEWKQREALAEALAAQSLNPVEVLQELLQANRILSQWMKRAS